MSMARSRCLSRHMKHAIIASMSSGWCQSFQWRQGSLVRVEGKSCMTGCLALYLVVSITIGGRLNTYEAKLVTASIAKDSLRVILKSGER